MFNIEVVITFELIIHPIKKKLMENSHGNPKKFSLSMFPHKTIVFRENDLEAWFCFAQEFTQYCLYQYCLFDL